MRVWPVLPLLLTIAYAAAADDDVANLYKHMKTILNNELGIEQMQKAATKYKYEYKYDDWTTRSTQAAATIGEIFETHFKIVKASRDAVRESHTDFSHATAADQDVTQCCLFDSSDLNTIVAIGSKGDTNRPCVRFSKNTTAIPPVSRALIKAMQVGSGNYKKRKTGDFNTLGMKWLYYGTEKGTHAIFPAHTDSNGCFFYDPRVRPWYVASASPLPKDIVIVLEMSETAITRKTADIIRQAANTVIDTMNENDRVGIVYFGSAQHPPDCHRKKLAYAIPATRRLLKKDILNHGQLRGEKFSEGLDAAFKLMNSPENDDATEPRKKAILFMTDGGPQDNSEDILKSLRAHMSKASDEILLLTYGIENHLTNSMLTEEDIELLRNMADVQKNNTVPTLQENQAFPDRFTILNETTDSFTILNETTDRFTILNETTDMRFKIGRYYRFFAKTSVDPIVTVPYVDYSGLGLIVSICLPVYYPGDPGNPNDPGDPGDTDVLQGVTCVDMSVSDLTLAELSVQDGYMFIFNTKNFRTLLHPLLPDPGHVAAFTADPVFMNIAVLEPDALDILEEMRNGTDGDRVINTTFTTSRGSAARDGVKTRTVEATYHYRAIKGTDFALAIVVPVDNKQVEIDVDDPVNFYPKYVHYCVDTAINEPVELCNNYGTPATKATSCIMLAPEAYVDVDEPDVVTLRKFLENEIHYDNTHEKLQPGVKEMVAITNRLERIWKNQTNASVEILWKYIVTYNGVLRLFPAVNMSQSLGYLHSDWFSKAVVDSQGEGARGCGAQDQDIRIIITTPRYEDITGREVVVSLLTNVFERSENGSGKHLAVMGMDVSLPTLEGIIKQSMGDCGTDSFSCFLMDDSGYIIFHDEFTEFTEPSQYVGGKHITEMESGIADYMIRKGHIEHKHCLSLGSIWNHTTWRMSADFESDDDQSFSIRRVPLTNTYLVKKRSDESFTLDGATPCTCDTKQSEEPGLAVCKDVSSCQCPCYKESDKFKRCSNKFDHIEDPICTPNQTSLLPSKPKWAAAAPANISQLYAPCFEVICSDIHNKWQCSSFRQCQWCSKSEECSQAGQQCRTGGVNIAAIVVPVLLILLVLAVVGAFLLYRWRKNNLPNKQSPETIYDDIADPPHPHINEAYIDKFSETYLTTMPSEVNRANGAPISRIPSCTGRTPPGPPPQEVTILPSLSDPVTTTQFPYAELDSYLTMRTPSPQLNNSPPHLSTSQDKLTPHPRTGSSSDAPLSPDLGTGAMRDVSNPDPNLDDPDDDAVFPVVEPVTGDASVAGAELQGDQLRASEMPAVHGGNSQERKHPNGQLSAVRSSTLQRPSLPVSSQQVSEPQMSDPIYAKALPRHVTPACTPPHSSPTNPPSPHGLPTNAPPSRGSPSHPPSPHVSPTHPPSPHVSPTYPPPPLPSPRAPAPHRQFSYTTVDGKEEVMDDEYLTMKTTSSSFPHLPHLSSSQANLPPHSRAGSSSDAPLSPDSGIAESSFFRQPPIEQEEDSVEENSNETVIECVRL